MENPTRLDDLGVPLISGNLYIWTPIMDDDNGWYMVVQPFFHPFQVIHSGAVLPPPQGSSSVRRWSDCCPSNSRCFPWDSWSNHLRNSLAMSHPEFCGWASDLSCHQLFENAGLYIYIYICLLMLFTGFQPSKKLLVQDFAGPSTVGKLGWFWTSLDRCRWIPQWWMLCWVVVLKQDDYVTEDEIARIRNSSVLASVRAPKKTWLNHVVTDFQGATLGIGGGTAWPAILRERTQAGLKDPYFFSAIRFFLKRNISRPTMIWVRWPPVQQSFPGS